jgi:hypothetical protein
MVMGELLFHAAAQDAAGTSEGDADGVHRPAHFRCDLLRHLGGMIAQMHQFTGAGCQMIETTLKRRGFSLKRLLIHGAVCVKQFDDIFIEPRHTPSSIPLKG